MSRPPDVLDEQIRAALARTPGLFFDADTVVPVVVGRARVRRRRRLATRTAASMLAVGLLAVGLANRSDQRVTVSTKPPITTEASPRPAYPLDGLYLSDGPLPDVPMTLVTTAGPFGLLVDVSQGMLSWSLLIDGEVAESLAPMDPQEMEAVGVTGGSDSRVSKDHLLGITRSEVDHVVLTVSDGEFRADAITLDDLPELHFFLIELPPTAFDEDAENPPWDVVAYDRDGRTVWALR